MSNRTGAEDQAWSANFDEVLAAARSGEEWAWASIYRDLAGPVTGYLASRGASDPEDLASETFLQIARNIHTFHGSEGSFRSWVFVIAHRRLLDARRAAGRRLDTTPLDKTALDPPGGNVESEAVDRMATAEILEMLESLTEDQRDVLALRVVANLTLEETAEVLGKRVGAVKGLQRRALMSLRDRMAVEGVSK